MRTTLDVDDELLDAARRRAEEQGTTLTAIIEEALAAALAPRAQGRDDYKLRWKVHRGRLLPGIDIADRDSLFDAMENRR
jgi:predicted transcriptional regulator